MPQILPGITRMHFGMVVDHVRPTIPKNIAWCDPSSIDEQSPQKGNVQSPQDDTPKRKTPTKSPKCRRAIRLLPNTTRIGSLSQQFALDDEEVVLFDKWEKTNSISRCNPSSIAALKGGRKCRGISKAQSNGIFKKRRDSIMRSFSRISFHFGVFEVCLWLHHIQRRQLI
jgi:hypothetical protein